MGGATVLIIRLILLTSLLSGCAIIASSVGSSPTTISALETLDYTKSAVDVVVYAETKKTLTDHLISKILHKNCRLFNIFSDSKICVPEGKQVEAKQEVN